MPGSITDTLFDRDSHVIKELIGSNVEVLSAQIEPSFRDMVLGAMKAGAELQSSIGRDFRIKKKYKAQAAAGVIRGGHLTDFQALYGGSTSTAGTNIRTFNSASTAPNPLGSAQAQPFGLTSELHCMDFNVPMDLTMLQLEATPANINEHIVPLLEGVGRLIAMWMAHSWHANSEQNYRISSLGPSTGDNAYSIDTTNKTIKFYPPEKTIHKYITGMPVDIYTNATTRANETGGTRELLFVEAVNKWQGWVKLAALASDTDFATWTAAAGSKFGESAFVTYMDNYDTTFAHRGMYSWRDWTIYGGPDNADNRLLRGNAITDTANDYIDIRSHPQFESGHFTVDGVLTEQKLTQYMARMMIAWQGTGNYADTGLAAEGIWERIFAQYQAKEFFDRGNIAGQPASLHGMGVRQGFTFTFGDEEYRHFTSGYMDDGTILYYRRLGNWALVTPPTPAGVQRGGGGLASEDLSPIVPYEFYMKALGANKEVVPLQKTDASGYVLPTPYAHMPGFLRAQFIPVEQIPAMLLDGITSTRLYAVPPTT